MTFEEWFKDGEFGGHTYDLQRRTWEAAQEEAVLAERNRCVSICKDYPDLVGQIRRYSNG